VSVSDSDECRVVTSDDLLAYVRSVWAHRWVIIACSILGAAISATLAMTATILFRAEVTVSQVEAQGSGMASLANQLGGVASLIGVSLGANNGSSREVKALLQSRVLIEELIRQPGVHNALYPKGQTRPSAWSMVKKVREDVVAVKEDKRSGLTVISVTWVDAATAAKWANQLVTLANEMMRKRALTESAASIAYLNAEMSKVDEIEVKRAMYGLIEAETKKQMLANIRQEYALSVIDPAITPELRLSPRRTAMVVLGTVLGLLVGLMVATTRELFQRLSSRM
jgi:uncharacterized protein involved in exopolysaccharide biosynthesis